jgi:hypothetical protein
MYHLEACRIVLPPFAASSPLCSMAFSLFQASVMTAPASLAAATATSKKDWSSAGDGTAEETIVA